MLYFKKYKDTKYKFLWTITNCLLNLRKPSASIKWSPRRTFKIGSSWTRGKISKNRETMARTTVKPRTPAAAGPMVSREHSSENVAHPPQPYSGSTLQVERWARKVTPQCPSHICKASTQRSTIASGATTSSGHANHSHNRCNRSQVGS